MVIDDPCWNRVGERVLLGKGEERTVHIQGKQRIAGLNGEGELCASLLLDGSDDCAASNQVSTDGSLALYQYPSCSLVWWPRLGEAH